MEGTRLATAYPLGLAQGVGVRYPTPALQLLCNCVGIVSWLSRGIARTESARLKGPEVGGGGATPCQLRREQATREYTSPPLQGPSGHDHPIIFCAGRPPLTLTSSEGWRRFGGSVLLVPSASSPCPRAKHLDSATHTCIGKKKIHVDGTPFHCVIHFRRVLSL